MLRENRANKHVGSARTVLTPPALEQHLRVGQGAGLVAFFERNVAYELDLTRRPANYANVELLVVLWLRSDARCGGYGRTTFRGERQHHDREECELIVVIDLDQIEVVIAGISVEASVIVARWV